MKFEEDVTRKQVSTLGIYSSTCFEVGRSSPEKVKAVGRLGEVGVGVGIGVVARIWHWDGKGGGRLGGRIRYEKRK